MLPAEHFCGTLQANVDNPKLTDDDFRQLVRNTLPIVKFPQKGEAEPGTHAVAQPIVPGSINDPNRHPEYALRKAREVATRILKDESASASYSPAGHDRN